MFCDVHISCVKSKFSGGVFYFLLQRGKLAKRKEIVVGAYLEALQKVVNIRALIEIFANDLKENIKLSVSP